MNTLAPISVSYEHAKQALAICTRLDECKDWADKAAALRVYARQANDTELFEFAKRVQARTVRREGELLEEFKAQERRTVGLIELLDGTVKKLPTIDQAVKDAGLTERQRQIALRVAAIPEQEWEAMLEAETLPTIYQLVEKGIRRREQQNQPSHPPITSR